MAEVSAPPTYIHTLAGVIPMKSSKNSYSPFPDTCSDASDSYCVMKMQVASRLNFKKTNDHFILPSSTLSCCEASLSNSRGVAINTAVLNCLVDQIKTVKGQYSGEYGRATNGNQATCITKYEWSCFMLPADFS